ncbi:MAG: hypothetical protein HQ541_03425 [Mariniphaga sp.]|nr:hypothetical protein [Mariniphaga sp.]
MRIVYVLLIFLTFPFWSTGQNNWYANFSPGVDFVPPMPLIINQSGYEKISFWANYESVPLKAPVYYSYRIGFINEAKGWEAEMNHLKVYLKNKPEEIQRFSISHGYNLLFVNRVIHQKKYGSKVGFGIVLAHPENTIRNFSLDENEGILNWGYYVAGPAIQYGIFKEIALNRTFFIIIESKVSLAYANIPVKNGRAHVPVLAFHLQLGPGIYFRKKGR